MGYMTKAWRVREALAAAEIDAVLVTTPADMAYLTGYDIIS